jgi:hypothetical protein
MKPRLPLSAAAISFGLNVYTQAEWLFLFNRFDSHADRLIHYQQWATLSGNIFIETVLLVCATLGAMIAVLSATDWNKVTKALYVLLQGIFCALHLWSLL